jgi:UDP-MurNAc hydroxylase
MVDDLRWLGFHDIVEVPHGGRVLLGDDFEMRSYQFGIAVDSAVVLASSKITIFNCNDAKFFGQPLRQIMRDWPTIDFILRSHSSAGPLPYCVENWQEILSGIEAREYDSADQFARCAQYVGARYAIPFASNHCFLHPETTRFNGTATTPEAAQERFAQLAAESGYQGECVVMPPGSRWSEEGGFALSTFDFSRRKQYIEQLGAKYRDQLAETQRLEDETLADFGTFRDYFEGLLRALPPFVGRRWLLPVAFRTTDRHGTRDWIVDPKSGTVTEDIQAPRSHVVFEVHPRVLNDCTAKRMFSVWSASKRLKIHLPEASHLRATSLWLMVLDLYEVDTLPLWRNFTLRSVAVRLRRWREVVEAGRIVLRRLVFRKPFSVAEIYIR